MDGLIQYLTPDRVMVKMRALPMITIDTSPGAKPSLLGKIFHPRIYLLKGDAVYKVDPITKVFSASSLAAIKKEMTGITIIDVLITTILGYIVYRGVKAIKRR